MVQSLKFSLAQSNPLPKPAQSMQMRQQLLPNCWLTPLWLRSLKILQKTYKSLYISSGSFRIWKSAAACFMMIPFPCIFRLSFLYIHLQLMGKLFYIVE